MYLVDTSVWIDFIRGQNAPAVNHLQQILKAGQLVGICSVIYQEILQGSESQQRFNQFKNYFSGLTFYHPKHNLESYDQAAHIYFTCRRLGITVRSTIDCLIVQIAIEHDLILLHSDKDFTNIGNVIPALKLYSQP